MSVCEYCKTETKETCPDGYCKACHVSIEWEDCCSGSWNARMLLSNGHTVEEIKKLYPDAKI